MAAPLASKDVCTVTSDAAVRHSPWRWLLLVVLIAVAVRSAHLTRPLLGNFATKNAAYGMIARNFARNHAPVWRPTLDVLADGQRGAHLLEVPLSAYAAGLGWKLLGDSLDCWGRCVSVLCSAVAAALLVVLGGRWFGVRAGGVAGLAYALSPVAIIYGQSFMLESSVAMLSVAAVLTFDLWRSQKGWPWFALCGVILAALFLTKIFMLVICLPLGWLAFRPPARSESLQSTVRRGPQRSTLALTAVLIVLAATPAVCWLIYVGAVSGSPEESKHVFYSLRNSAAAHAWPPPILRSADFYRQLLDDLVGIVLTPVGFVLAILGLTDQRWRKLVPWLFSSLLLVLTLPLKFHEMNYYFVTILPPSCLLIGVGYQQLTQVPQLNDRRWQVGFLVLAILFSARYAARPAFVTPSEDSSVLASAQAVGEVVGPGARVISVHGSSIDLLYYCDRAGWALAADDPKLSEKVADLAADGADAIVIANVKAVPAETLREFRARYPQLRAGQDYVVFDLALDGGSR